MKRAPKMFSICLAVFAVLVRTIYGQQSYVQIFFDDFLGTTVDQTKWNQVNQCSQVNGEQQCYIASETYLDGQGNLVLQSDNVQSQAGYPYISGHVDSRDKFTFLYGDIEWNAILPKGQGFWPALWLLRNECPAAVPCPAVDWPPEIDVMEARGDLVTQITTTLHSGVYALGTWVYNTQAFIGPDFTAGYHKFKASWNATQVSFYVDGNVVFSITDPTKVPQSPLYITMNTAVGGQYPGSPDATTPWPGYFKIDYVSVYQWQATTGLTTTPPATTAPPATTPPATTAAPVTTAPPVTTPPATTAPPTATAAPATAPLATTAPPATTPATSAAPATTAGLGVQVCPCNEVCSRTQPEINSCCLAHGYNNGGTCGGSCMVCMP